MLLQELREPAQLLAGVPPAKVRHFAAEARSLDAAELKDIASGEGALKDKAKAAAKAIKEPGAASDSSDGGDGGHPGRA